MNGSYNHIKHFVDRNDEVQNNLKTWNGKLWLKFYHAGNHGAKQLDGKQRHTGLDYYEYDMSKFGAPGWAQWAKCLLDWSSFNFQEDLEDLEHDQARRQGIHDHGCDQIYYDQHVPPGITYNFALFNCICAFWR